MKARGGFTLLELVVALVVTGVVALLAYATLQAGLDTSERIERSYATVSGQAVARALLVDALRHLPEGGGGAMDEPLLTLEDQVGAGGLPNDVLSFVTYGIGSAPGAAGAWTLTLGASDGGVRLRAEPLDPADGAAFDLRLPEAAALEVRVLARDETDWTDVWDRPGRVPAAVRLRLLDARGEPVGPPLIVQTALEGLP